MCNSALTNADYKHTLWNYQGVRMYRKFKSFLTDTSGVSAIEYAMIASLIAVAAIAGMTSLGTKQSAQWNNVDNNL